MSADHRVLAPERIFKTVRKVAPDPGSPPVKAESILPSPCPTSSRLLLCCVLLIISATREVSNVSTEPIRASVNEGTNTSLHNV